MGFSVAQVNDFITSGRPTAELQSILDNLEARGLREFVKVDICKTFDINTLTLVFISYLVAFGVIFFIKKNMENFPQALMWGVIAQLGYFVLTLQGMFFRGIFLWEIFIPLIGLWFVLIKPGVASVSFLLIYDVWVIIKNLEIKNLDSADMQKLLMLHVFLKGFAILFLIGGLIEFNKKTDILTENSKGNPSEGPKDSLPKQEMNIKTGEKICPKCGSLNSDKAFRCKNEDCLEKLPVFLK